MKRCLAFILLIISLPINAQNTADSIPEKTSFFKKAGGAVVKVFEKISETDTAYIRPQEYNWAAMMQSTTTFESYRLKTKSGHDITFAPKSKTKIGPYGGWRWAFLGYTFDLKDITFRDGLDIDFSFYTPIFNVDLLWRESDNNTYKIRKAVINNEENVNVRNDIPFNGMQTYVKGFNFNYVLKHKRFSYTAAFAQSCCQKLSAGSPIVGVGYMYHKLNLDHDKLCATLSADSTLAFRSVQHGSLSFSGGYAYNWVPTRNMLFASSLTAGIAFKKSFGNIDNEQFSYRDFRLQNVNFDGCGRFALVYNNMKWFAGASSVIHYYTYNKGQFSTANWYATINIYAGFNFGRRKHS